MSSLSEIKSVKKVSINIGGQDRTLSYDMNAYALMEERYGSVEAALDALGKVGNIKATIFMLWVGLAHEAAVVDKYGEITGYSISQKEVGSWMGINSVRAVAEKINEAMGATLPEIEKDEEAVKRLNEAGYEIKNGQVVPIEGFAQSTQAKLPEGTVGATIVETPEEKIARLEQEVKNGPNAL